MSISLDPSELELLHAVVGQHGRLIFAMRCGSWAYNMQTPKSDRDYFGVYISNYKGPFFPIKSSFDRSGGGEDSPDYAIYEAETYCKLLAKGNPKMVEPLYTENLCWYSDEWVRVRGSRHISINRTVAKQYLGFAYAELKTIRNKAVEDISKPVYHARRLLHEANRILDGLPPQVWLTGDLRDELMQIRQFGSKSDRIQLEETVEKTYRAVADKLDSDVAIPAAINSTPLSAWIVQLRLGELEQVSISAKLTPPDLRELPSETHPASLIISQVQSHLNTVSPRQCQVILACGPTGSAAFNMPTANTDWICLYACSTQVALDPFDESPKIHKIGDSKQNNSKFYSGIMAIEVEEALRQFMRGQHQIVELLGSQRTWLHEWMKNLIQQLGGSLQPCFTISTLMHYVGVAEGLVLKAKSSGKFEMKAIGIAFRLILQARKVEAGAFPDNVFSQRETQQLQELAQTTTSETRVKEVMEDIEGYCKSFKSAEKRKTSLLPDKMNESYLVALNTWLLVLRFYLKNVDV